MKRTYIGAYSRRFSNYSASNKETYGSDQGGTGTYSLNVSSGNPEMGEAGFIKLASSSPFATQTAAEPTVNNRGGYAAGTAFRAVAKPYEGYQFVKWQTNIEGVGNTTQNPIEFKLNHDTSLVAIFERASFSNPTVNKTATVRWDSRMGRVNGNGLVLSDESRASGGQITASQGSTVTLTASPLDGFHFVKWHGAPVDGKTSKTVTFAMNADYTIRAEFAADDSSSSSSSSGAIGTSGGAAGGSHEEPAPEPGTVTKPSTTDRVVAFAKKWWWAILIVAYIVYKERKGGSK